MPRIVSRRGAIVVDNSGSAEPFSLTIYDARGAMVCRKSGAGRVEISSSRDKLGPGLFYAVVRRCGNSTKTALQVL
jgi:hypothetical protein